MFKKKKPKVLNLQPIPKGFYAWNNLHAGSFLVFVESLKDCYQFIFLPGPSIMHLTVDNFSQCILNNTLEFIEQLPDDVYQQTLELSQKESCPVHNKTIELQ